MTTRILLLFLLLLVPLLSRAQDWPTFRHDNRRSGASPERLAFPLELRWTHEGGTPRQAWSGPAKWDAYSGNANLQSMRNFDPCHYVTVSGGLVYYGSSHDNAVHALDAATGTERWVHFAEAPVRLPPTVFEGAAYAGSDDGFLYALDARTGNLRWKDHAAPTRRAIPSNAGLISLWPVRTTPLLQGGRLYYSGSLTPWHSSWLVSVDPASGAEKETAELSGVTLQGAFLATSQLLIAPQGRSSPLLFELPTMSSKGSIGHAGGVFCLVTDDEEVLAGPSSQKPKDSQLLLTDAAGKKVATFNDTNRAVLSGKVAYLHSRGLLQAVSYTENSQQLWKVETPVPSELIVCANAVLVGLEGSVQAYARDTGELLWSAPTRGRVHGLAVANGTLYASTERGAIHAFRP